MVPVSGIPTMVTSEEIRRGIEENDWNSLIAWLSSNSHNSVNIRCSDGNTFLTVAVKKGRVDVVPFLLAKGADIDLRDARGATPLLLAIHLNRLDMVQCLITRKADINLGDSYDTPLTTAVRRRHIEIAAFLIDNGADATVGDVTGTLPILMALKENNLVMVDLFLSKNVSRGVTDPDQNTVLIFAIKNHCNLEMIQCLLKHGLDANESKNGKTPLAWAAVDGNVQILKLLLSSGADINLLSSDGNTALATAVQLKQSEAAIYLAKKGANFCKVGPTGKTPFLWAIQNEDLDMMKSLLDNGAEYIIDTIFLDAIATGNLQIVELLTERAASIQMEKQTNETTPLMKSLETGSIEMVKYLLDNGASVVDDLGKNEISTIIRFLNERNIPMVRLLTENGARVGELSDCGETLLTKSIQLEYFDMVKYFVAQRANVNQPNKQGLTPLVIADTQYSFQIFQYIVDCGAILSEEVQTQNPKLAKLYRIAKERSLGRSPKQNSNAHKRNRKNFLSVVQ